MSARSDFDKAVSRIVDSMWLNTFEKAKFRRDLRKALAGYRLVGPGELDPETVAQITPKTAIRGWDLVRGLDKGALRLDADMKPVAVINEWPRGCHSPNSCTRNEACMYTNCPHEGSDISTAIRSLGRPQP